MHLNSTLDFVVVCCVAPLSPIPPSPFHVVSLFRGIMHKISYLVEAVNSSGRRAAMLRALSEDPMEVVPRLEAQMLADEEVRSGKPSLRRLLAL